MQKVQPAVDVIDTRLESLRKEVVDFEACRERFLFVVTTLDRF